MAGRCVATSGSGVHPLKRQSKAYLRGRFQEREAAWHRVRLLTRRGIGAARGQDRPQVPRLLVWA